MKYYLTPYSSTYVPFAYWENAFTSDELDWLQVKAKENAQPAAVGGGGEGSINYDVRRSSISWLRNTPDVEWVYYKLGHIVSTLNANHFQFDLTEFESIQLTNYSATNEGMYGWHIDAGSANQPNRKLSLVLQLSDPVEYEGGVLELKSNSDNPYRISKQRGYVALFPSWTLHQVTPVTQGTRQSLVIWITGPRLR